MSFNLKDIHNIAATTSVAGDMKLPVDLPTGVGQNHNLRSLTKAVLLTFDENAVPTRQDGGAGAVRVLNLKGLDNFLEFLGAEQALLLRGQVIGVSADGVDIEASIGADGSVNGSSVVVKNEQGTYTIVSGQTQSGNIDATLFEQGEIQVNPKTFSVDVESGDTVNLKFPSQWQAVRINTESSTILSSLEIDLPENARDGIRVSLYFTQGVANLVWNTDSGDSIENNPSAVSEGNTITMVYNAVDSVWWRLCL